MATRYHACTLEDTRATAFVRSKALYNLAVRYFIQRRLNTSYSFRLYAHPYYDYDLRVSEKWVTGQSGLTYSIIELHIAGNDTDTAKERINATDTLVGQSMPDGTLWVKSNVGRLFASSSRWSWNNALEAYCTQVREIHNGQSTLYKVKSPQLASIVHNVWPDEPGQQWTTLVNQEFAVI
jgi:hypothetical protein